MKKIFIICISLIASVCMQAQYVVNSNYDVWFEGTADEMTTRKSVACTENYQDLWNGCHVRLTNGRVYVYQGSSPLVWGDEINLLYNGFYRVKHSNTWYLYAPNGDMVSSVYGQQILYYPFNYVACKKGSKLWYVYDCDGNKLDFYSDVSPWICSNECWIVQQGSKQYGVDQNGDKISGVYGDNVSLVNGKWKCINGNYVSYRDGN